ncbi:MULTISPECIES: AMP-binding protein [unclassified Massilia]|uniref:AMP-binding protein n=1 Tax=unclassified Massilia TaxID=2609279 RepID=UPI00177F843A|nr:MULTISPECIES: AMP-binding protein [unclassified Massilia]MBD8528947.1 AMP-binding protein [Massilia sp. CFBP 13647]MBD8673589.1 AMP-binding protein [Massilia sp. CFBP 13721]
MQQSLSYVHGAHDVPLIGETIGHFLANIAREYGDNEALVVPHQNVRWTYTEFDARVSRLAAGLLALGLQPGDRIGIWSQNCAEWVLVQFATARAGLVMVNINPAYRRSELEYVLDKVGCAALILAPAFKSSDYLAILQDVVPEIAHSAAGKLQSAGLPQLRHVIRLGADKTPGMHNFDDVLVPEGDPRLAQLAELEATLQFDEPVNIQFTSGTTGAPKGATLTHHNILNNGFFVGEAMRLSSRDRLCIPVPLYHCFGMVLGNLACVTHGATMVFPGESFEPKAVLETVQMERCTGLHGVPTMFITLLDHPDFANYDLSTLRTGIMAGSPCPAEVMSRVIEKMHLGEITIAYGMTETSPVSFQSSVDDPVPLRVATIGRVHPHLEVKIVDADGKIVPRGVKGELLTRGYSVMLGYWGDEEKTRETIDAARWMHTGDLAVIDEQGFATIVGRAKDMVIRGGENIYPREIEEFLYRHPKILDVQCVGVPDAKYGEELCACIVLRPGMEASEDEIRDFCKGQIAHYKIPRHIRFVAGFPMTVTGKIQKYLLRQQVTTELGLAG